MYVFSGLGRKLNRSGISLGYIFLLFPVKIPWVMLTEAGEILTPSQLSDSLV